MAGTGIYMSFAALVIALIVNVSADCYDFCPEPKICTKIYEPVCGLCEGKLINYSNRCIFDSTATCSNNIFVHDGECKTDNLCTEECQTNSVYVCGYDKIDRTFEQYTSRCQMKKLNVCHGKELEEVNIENCRLVERY